MKNKRWIEVNLEKKYIVFEDKPKEKVPIADGSISLDLNKKTLNVQIKVKNENRPQTPRQPAN